MRWQYDRASWLFEEPEQAQTAEEAEGPQLHKGARMSSDRYHPVPDGNLPPGYVLAVSSWLDSRQEALAVPHWVLTEINQRAEAEQAEDKDHGEANLRKQEGPVPRSKSEFGLSASTSSGWQVDLAPFEKSWRKPRHAAVKVWDPAKVRRQVLAHNAGTGYSDTHSRARATAVFRAMAASGPWRRCARPEDVSGSIQRLRQEFPHWSHAVDLVADHLTLSLETNTPLRVPPMLLVGPPGVGKTHFARRVAQVIGAPMHLIDYSCQQTNGHLHGSDRHWSNTKQGVLFDEIVMGEFANPVLVLDELDKAANTATGNGYNPLAPLHQALEPTTARRTRDLSAEVEFDASFAIYIATANSLKGLPDSLLSRLQIILCPAADASLSYGIAKAVIEQVMSNGPGKHFEAIPRAVMRELALHTPRSIVMLLERSMARASRAGRRNLKLEDLQAQCESPSMH